MSTPDKPPAGLSGSVSPIDQPQQSSANTSPDLQRFIRAHLVTILGVFALASVICSWTLDVFFALKPVGNLPVIYDLSLAYLAGWFFHILVVVLPERQRLRQLIRTLQGHLMMIANNGRDLIRDLELIGECPERAIDSDHVDRVLRTIGYGNGQRFVAQRLSVAREAFAKVEPHLTSLPIELSMALQRVEQVFLHTQLRVPKVVTFDDESSTLQPADIRNSGSIWPKVNGEYVPKRWTMIGWKESILDYYEKTEAVRSAIPAKFILKSPIDPEHVEFWHLHKLNTPTYPFQDYPSTAFSDDWVGPPPPRPDGLGEGPWSVG